jgi:hypothetical protein
VVLQPATIAIELEKPLSRQARSLDRRQLKPENSFEPPSRFRE